MRVPTDLPRRRPRPARGRIYLAIAAAVLFLLLISLRGIAGFYTDYLWFDALDLSRVWRGVLGAKLALAAVFSVVFFVVLLANLLIADRLAPRFRPPGPEEELVERYHELIAGRTGLVRVVVSLLFALIAGVGTSSHWNSWLLFTNKQSFGQADPQFDRDIGYYVFELPFQSFVVDWAFAAMVIILIVTAVAHYLNGGIRVQVPAAQRVSPQVKAHLSVLLAALALLKAAGYWLQRYELTFSTRGVVDGASYTDVKAQLPALYLLVAISLFAAVLFLVNSRMRGWALPIIAVGLWAFTSVVVGGAYPAFVQRFRVEPNESQRERTYIERNIEATRAALRLGEDAVTVRTLDYQENLDAAAIAENEQTIRNVRLWDPGILRLTYAQDQEIRRFYRFNDVDVDRYEIDGRTTQVMISARELDLAGLPSNSWENTHLNFTHGFGAVLSPANAVTEQGLPDYLVQDLPPEGEPEITQPRVYFGENLGGYAIVGTNRPEIDYQTDEETKRFTYPKDTGTGVKVNSLVRRLALALRFGDINPVISSYITGDSRALYVRDIKERVRKLAPFLKFDDDPYPVIVDGEMVWVIDAYTTTSRYPYAQRAATDRLRPGADLRGRFNYVRNSVKATVDAFTGDVNFYVTDRDDPIVAAYREAFPQLFEPGDVPEDLQPHIRYPEDLFRVQTEMYGLYHIDDPAEFYDGGDAWDIARDPGSGRVATAPATGGGATGTTVAPPVTRAASGGSGGVDDRMDPYYLLMRLPGEEDEGFLMLQPFTPAQRNLLSSFMVARSDYHRDGYGKLEVFEVPRDKTIAGPRQVDARINQEPEISQQISLLSRAGSRVINGNLLLIPVNDSILYIRPLYVEAEGTPVPELKFVVATYGDRVAFSETLEGTLEKLFGEGTSPPPPTDTPPPTPTPDTPPADQSVAQLLEQASQAYERAQAALRNGDLAAYQREVNEMNRLINEARRRSAGDAPPPTTTTTAPASA